MYQSPVRCLPVCGATLSVRAGFRPHRGPWPSDLLVWHGNADKTVIPPNAREIVKQWTDVHDLPATPARRSTGSMAIGARCADRCGGERTDRVRHHHRTWRTAHRWRPATGEGACGAAGPFLLQVGISSSYHIAKFFGLTNAGARPVSSGRRQMARRPRSLVPVSVAADAIQPRFLEGEVLHGEVLNGRAGKNRFGRLRAASHRYRRGDQPGAGGRRDC